MGCHCNQKLDSVKAPKTNYIYTMMLILSKMVLNGSEHMIMKLSLLSLHASDRDDNEQIEMMVTTMWMEMKMNNYDEKSRVKSY